MSRMPWLCLVGIWSFAAGCAPEPEATPGSTLTLTQPEPTEPTPEPTEPEPTCGPTELCTRTIDECAIVMELAACEAWYADETQCADMAAYTACNCDCVEEDTCDAYFGCGELCFQDHC